MEHGPIPPHERQWRHPSELAAEERAQARAEPMPIASRAVALATGSIGLVALAVVFLVMTPARQAAPVAVSATTNPVAEPAGTAESSATIVAARRTESEVPTSTSPVMRAALATPIGSGEYAVVLRASLGADGEMPDLVLPSGRVTSGEVMGDAGDSGEAVLVHLADREPGHEVAERRPDGDDVVTVMTDPPISVALDDLDEVEAADGTAVVDAAGDLVGLCSDRGGSTDLVEVAADATDGGP